MTKEKSINLIKYFLIALGVAILFFFMKTLRLEDIKLALSHVTISNLIMVLLLTLGIVLIKALRWKFLIKKTTGVSISSRFALGSILSGLAAGMFTPGRGGEIAKPLLVKEAYGVSLSKSISAVFIEKMLELSATLLLAIASIILLGGAILGDYMWVSIFGGIILVILVLMVKFTPQMKRVFECIFRKIVFVKSIREKVLKLIDIFFTSLSMLKKKRVAFLFVSISVFSDLLEVLKLYYIFNILGLLLSFSQVLFILEASIVFALATMIPGGIGITEIAQASIFSAFDSSGEQVAKVGILIDRVLSYYLLIFLGTLILILYRVIYKKEIRLNNLKK